MKKKINLLEQALSAKKLMEEIAKNKKENSSQELKETRAADEQEQGEKTD